MQLRRPQQDGLEPGAHPLAVQRLFALDGVGQLAGKVSYYSKKWSCTSEN